MQIYAPQDLTRVTLQILWIGLLIFATFWIMKPFIPSLIWAAMIVAATWQLMIKVESWLWGRRSLAVTAMTLVILFTFIVPFSLAILAIFENADRIVAWLKAIQTMSLPPSPKWLAGIPLAGPRLEASWQNAAVESELLSAKLAPYGGMILRWFLTQAGSFGVIAIQFLLTVIIAAAFYAKGEVVAGGVLRLARRLGGSNGEEVAVLAARTVKGVALGVVGTALIQSLLGGIGLAAAGVPAATLLTALIFMLCIAQIQPWLVMVPAVIW
ncbi:MAG: AI-2E family transporter, partial [Syntrophaceae bacterium]